MSREAASSSITVSDQYEILIERMRTRRRNPLKESSLAAYRAYAKNWICPIIGETALADFGPREMKEFVSKLAASLAPKTTNEVVSFAKQIIASTTDAQGLPLYPRVWDSDFIDLPIVDSRQQKTPSVSRADIERVLGDANDTMTCLIACLAGSGLRINEALAIRLDDPSGPHTVFDVATSTIHVRRGLWRGREQSSPKTANAIRSVEIACSLGAMLSDFAGQRGGYLFGNGRPFAETTAREHLAKLKLPPFHSLRRFYVSHKRENGMPEDILRALVGHASGSMTDHYSTLGRDPSRRRAEVERCGLGFTLPTSFPTPNMRSNQKGEH